MAVSKDLLEYLLACPQCKGDIRLNEKNRMALSVIHANCSITLKTTSLSC